MSFGPEASFDPREIFAALERHRVSFVTVGAFALIAHGVIRATGDVDVVPEPSASNRERLVLALADLEGHPDGEPQTPIDVALLSRDANMRFQTRHGQLDLLCAAQYVELYGRLAAGAVRTRAAGIEVPVVGREDLIFLKAGTGRDRDLRDIGDLLTLEAGAGPPPPRGGPTA